ncbi:hypothetical protein EON65_00540 [archaeon]|nr:MAG: hypothetical protein EON65_00540 [archaeon]
MADGHIIKLDKLSEMERKGKAKLLLSNPGIKVYRHLVDGDVLLVNRQPTLHKPGIMAHKARVLRHVKEQTLRMNYANCNTYNADFDGDEMNCHFVQSELARAEAYTICNTDNQYIVPTSGNPLRGLIQDHVASAVKLTCKDTFLDKAKFQQLVYIAVSGLSGTEIVAPTEDIILPPPVILKPKPMWSGKQVITALLANLCRPPLPPLQLDSKARTPPTAFGTDQGEHEVMIRSGELLTGVLDKNAIGNVSMGLIHAVYELYGAELAGRLLNAFGRLMTYHLQTAGHSCGISDLVLTSTADAEREELLRAVNTANRDGLIEFLQQNGQDVKSDSSRSPAEVDKSLRHHMALYIASDRKNGKVKLDGAIQGVLNKSASNVIKACLPNGLQVPFLQNNFSMMVLTGAKGSAVNQSQISCFLGQQALEGQRVPVMASGKTLPSFKPFDGSARAGGFVRDRFLTGVRPQEYYFHCMAGREGLVDTAVKTSRSGYLQRCLVKHLEELTVAYDNTVRDSAGNVIQFLYGEDGLDPVHAAMLGGKANQMLFLARNHKALSYKYSLHDDFFNQGLQYEPALQHHKVFSKARDAMKKGSVGSLDKSAVVLARKRKDAGKEWSTSNICADWFVAEITKVRPHEKKYKYAVDLKYENGSTEKKVPIMVRTHAPSSSSNVGSERLFVPMVKLGLPTETAQSKLKLGNTVGAVSEKIQDSIVDYVTKNPDKVIHSEPSDSTVTAESLELLIWIKYMRSLACPGEAVGCVAAQSIGEPSTQMTLNTFHLAGHGGANVTLGIPRLREIIMTASKTLKTPMMVVPLAPNRTMEAARSLARKLSCLPLATLLHHQGGVEVGESMTRSSPTSRWERQYRIRLQFEPIRQIERAFGVTFDVISGIVQKQFLQKLDYLIKAEQRRAGESTSGKNDALKQFLSKVNPANEYRAKRGRGGEDEDGGNDNAEVMDVDDDEPKTTGKQGDDATSSDSEASENEDSDADTEGDGKQRSKAQGYGVNTKEQDSDDEDEEDGVQEDKGAGDDNNENAEEGDDQVIPKTPSKTPLKTPTKSHVTFKSFQENNPLVQTNEAAGYIELFVTFPIVNRRLLMIQLVEKACALTMVRSTKSIAKAYPLDDKDAGIAVQTEGVNFEAIWSLPDSLVNYNSIQCNDINAVLNYFGVEAARQCIVSEVQAVFKVYGIDVNPRHLALIADFMTRFGEFTPMNRMGMMKCSSPFLQMSFETTCTFLTRAAQEGLTDNMNSASARIVTGCVPKGGTGAFEIMLPLQQMQQRTGGQAESVFPRSNGGALFDFDMTMDE